MQINYLDIGARIRAGRTKQNLSQEKLAELVGVGTTHISHIETGNTVPSVKTFIGIINALELSCDELLRNHVYKSKHVFEGELAEAMKDCSAYEARIITDIVIALKTSLRHNTKN